MKLKNMIEKLEFYLRDNNFCLNLFKSVQMNFQDQNNPLRYNNVAYAMRELIRVYLEDMAPVKEIICCRWYTNESGEKDKITRRERIRFLLQGGLLDNELDKHENTKKNIVINNVIKKINELSKYTHVTHQTYALNNTDAEIKYEELIQIVLSVFKQTESIRQRIKQSIHDDIFESIQDHLWNEIPNAVDEISTHSTIEGVCDVEFVITLIDSNFIHMEGNGTVECELQYGSGSDLRNGNGALDSISLPFDFDAELENINLEKVTDVDIQVRVDNSKFYGEDI